MPKASPKCTSGPGPELGPVSAFSRARPNVLLIYFVMLVHFSLFSLENLI